MISPRETRKTRESSVILRKWFGRPVPNLAVARLIERKFSTSAHNLVPYTVCPIYFVAIKFLLIICKLELLWDGKN